MIVVTGATGQLGRAIVEELAKRVPAETIGVSVREPLNAKELAARGVRVRPGDFEDEASLREAFAGATQLLMISSNAAAVGKDPIAQHRRAIDAAKAAGVRRIVYTSQISASPSSAFNPGRDHAQTEALLRDSGVAFTSLRNGFYASHAVGVMMNAISNGELVTPADGKFSWVGHADLAQAAAEVLLLAKPIEGATKPLTGAQSLDFTDLAATAGELSGKEIRRVTVSDDEYVALMVKRGVPEGGARFALGMFEASRRGEFAAIDPLLEQLLGRAPTPVRELLAARLRA